MKETRFITNFSFVISVSKY